jgi:hypothetical protein
MIHGSYNIKMTGLFTRSVYSRQLMNCK